MMLAHMPKSLGLCRSLSGVGTHTGRAVSVALVAGILTLGGACRQQGADDNQAAKKPLPLGPAFVPQQPQAASVTRENAGLIEGATILTVTGGTLAPGYVLWRNGKIEAMGAGAYQGPREGLQVIAGAGRFVTPGLIDSHSHMGVYPLPQVDAHEDGNEATNPNTADVWAEHSFWPQDPQLWRALSGGITTIQVLPGSANLFGGRSFVAKLRPGVAARDMAFPGAPQGLKMACGENPKGVYGKKGGPATRMGNVAGYRKAFREAHEYRRRWQVYQRDLNHYEGRLKAIAGDEARMRQLGDPPVAPAFKARLATLAGVLDGRILVHNHCYRADEMALMLDLAAEFGFKIRSFHHALEAYKIRHRLAQHQVSVSTWADWWGFKMEAYDGVPYNVAMLADAGVRAIVHSDSGEDIRFLNQEAAKSARYGRELGLAFDENQVLAWITLNPAWALGVQEQVGSLEPGKQADLVIWDRHPLEGTALAEQVIIDGDLTFDRSQGLFRLADFEWGTRPATALYDGRSIKVTTPPVVANFTLPAREQTFAGAKGSVLIKNVLIAAGDGRPPFGPRHVEVRDGVIAAILPADSDQKVAPGMTVFEGAGRVLTPGLVATDTPLGLVEVGKVKSSRDDGSHSGQVNPGFAAYLGFNYTSQRLAISRAAGITTVAARPQKGLLAGQGFSFQNTGRYDALQFAQLGVYGSLGGSDDKSRGDLWLQIQQLTAESDWWAHQDRDGLVRDRRHLGWHDVHLRAWQDVLLGRQPLVMTVHRAADMLALMAWRREVQALNSAYQPRLVFAGATEAWRVADALRASRIPVLMTPSLQGPFQFDALYNRDDAVAYLLSQGVVVALTTSDIGVRRLRQQAIHAMKFGVPKDLALAAITSWPARILGLDNRGAITLGAGGDLVLWDHDPLAIDSRPVAVWVNGVPQNLENRQHQLARRYLK